MPPHITLSALECEEEEILVRSLETLMKGESAVSMKKGTLQWVSAGCFLPGVIFLQPVLNEYLQELAFEALQQEFSMFEDKVVRIGLAKMNPHREIMNWELKDVSK